MKCEHGWTQNLASALGLSLSSICAVGVLHPPVGPSGPSLAGWSSFQGDHRAPWGTIGLFAHCCIPGPVTQWALSVCWMNTSSHSVKQTLTPIDRWGNWSSLRWSDLPAITSSWPARSAFKPRDPPSKDYCEEPIQMQLWNWFAKREVWG